MILISFGTRPEWIKIKKIVDKIEGIIPYRLVCTSQHTEIIDESIKNYKVEYLSIDTGTNRLDDIVASILKKCYYVFQDIKYTMVQGDTTSAFAFSLASFHRRIPIIHLEAGLRSFDINNPYPEEFNRVAISNMADIHLCPTHENKNNLIKCPGTKYVTGNTVLDYLVGLEPIIEDFVLVTMHRRENLSIIHKWFEYLDITASENKNLEFILPMHPNPKIQKHRHLLKNVRVINPIPHDKCIDLIRRCSLVITDSGGIQEESAFLKKKCIVCRETTEREEGEYFFSELCHHPSHLPSLFKKTKIEIVKHKCPYGNGFASEAIIKILKGLYDQTR
jgi:UDP-N-acetylglucosamine 2-epimerase (non-hydrolysing)